MRSTRRGLITRSWFAIVVAAFVALLASGFPELVVQLVTGEAVACATDCDGSNGQKHCPPNCSHGVCAKTVPSVPGPVVVVQITVPLALAGELSAPPVETCHSRDSSKEVFHPPRA